MSLAYPTGGAGTGTRRPAIAATCADSNIIYTRRQVATDPLPRRTIRTSSRLS